MQTGIAHAASSILLTHGNVYSSRERVNVILPGTGYRGEGNNSYPPLRGGDRVSKIRRLIRQALADVARDVPRGWAATRAYTIHVGMHYTERGRYEFSVWSEDRIIVRHFDNSRWHSNGVSGDTVFYSVADADAYVTRMAPLQGPGQSVLMLSPDASARQFES